MSVNDLTYQLRPFLAMDEPDPEALEQAEGATLEDAKDVFFRTTGIIDTFEDKIAVQHAAMHFLDDFWPSPVRCSMVYHRDLAGFGKDLEYIYRELILNIPYYYSVSGNTKTLSPQAASELSDSCSLRTPESADLIRLLEQWDLESIKASADELDNGDILRLLHDATWEFDYAQLVSTRRGAAVVWANPLATLQPFYEYLYSNIML
jgi:hypothetical protein